jgi:hypothetical protein
MKVIFASLSVAMALILACGTEAQSGEGDMETLRAEVRAMRQAYEGRIAALEDEVKELKANGVPAQKSAQKGVDEALAKKGAAQTAVSYQIPGGANAVRGSTQITLGGYTEFTYTDRTTQTPRFNQLKTVAEISAKVDERINVYIEAEDENGGVIAGPEETQGEFEIEQAYLDYTIDKAVNFRAGVSLVPVGRYNLYHEGWLNNMTDRPLVDRRIIPTTWYEEGVGFYGTPIDNDSLGLTYEAYLYNPAAGNGVDPISGFRDIHNENKFPTSAQHSAAARLAFEPARSFPKVADMFEVGVSGYVSGYDGFKGTNADGDTVSFPGGRLYMTAADVTWERKNVGFHGEAAYAHTGAGENETGKQQSAWGYYAEGYYKFWPKFLTCTPFGKFKDPKLVAALRYDYVDLNTQAAATPSIQRVTATIGYRPLPRTVIKFDYQFDWLGSGIAGQDYDVPQDIETGLKKHNRAFLFSVSTGF